MANSGHPKIHFWVLLEPSKFFFLKLYLKIFKIHLFHFYSQFKTKVTLQTNEDDFECSEDGTGVSQAQVTPKKFQDLLKNLSPQKSPTISNSYRDEKNFDEEGKIIEFPIKNFAEQLIISREKKKTSVFSIRSEKPEEPIELSKIPFNQEKLFPRSANSNTRDNSFQWSITTHAQFVEENHFDDLKKFLFLLTTMEHQTLLENYVKMFFSHEDWNIAKLNADMKRNIQNPDPERIEENEKQIAQNLANLPSEKIEHLDQHIKM